MHPNMTFFEIKKKKANFSALFWKQKTPCLIKNFTFTFHFFVSQGSEVGRGEICGPQWWFVIT